MLEKLTNSINAMVEKRPIWLKKDIEPSKLEKK
jgi:hypothetical protein